ncbi:hypothetical protein ASF92_13865 [Pedobacter sp. Leaf176]|nr:hypothetical protein ASF92_13865 [Pedobacter sp. Leaf176]
METLTIKIPEEKSSAVKAILKQIGVTTVDRTKSGTLDLSPPNKKKKSFHPKSKLRKACL